MPWNPAQHRLFEAVAHNPEIAKRKGIPQSTASKLASEGIKKGPDHAKKLGKALRRQA